VIAPGRVRLGNVARPDATLVVRAGLGGPTGRRWPVWLRILIAVTALVLTGLVVRHVIDQPRWRLNGRTLPYRQQVHEYTGPKHCGWNDTTFLSFDRGTFVRDVRGRFSTSVAFEPDSTLPAGATDTGWRDGGRSLWIPGGSDTPSSVYIVDGDSVERWPAFSWGCM